MTDYSFGDDVDDVVDDDDDGDGSNYSFGSWRAAVSYSLAGLCLSVFLAGAVFLAAAVRSRSFTYNLYVAALLLPDTLLNLVLGIRCVSDGIRNPTGGGVPVTTCRFQQIGIAYYLSNVFLNAVVSREMHELVRNSYRRKRTRPPTPRKILAQVACVYAGVGLFATWQVLPYGWAGKTVVADPYCNATGNLPKHAESGMFLVLIVPPVAYMLWVSHMVRPMLPIRGRTRVLALYFCRVIALFILFYVPVTIVILAYGGSRFFGGDDDDDRQKRGSASYFWLSTAFTVLNPIQTVVSVVIFSQKDDIRDSLGAVVRFVSFRTNRTSTRLSTTTGAVAGPALAATTSTTADSTDVAATTATARNRNCRESAWREHDTYAKEDGMLAVVRYGDAEVVEEEEEGKRPTEDGENNNSSSYSSKHGEKDRGSSSMDLWMSRPFTVQLVPATDTTELVNAPETRLSQTL